MLSHQLLHPFTESSSQWGPKGTRGWMRVTSVARPAGDRLDRAPTGIHLSAVRTLKSAVA